MRRQKMYAAIKIGGFALSIAACLLIALYIGHELSYDRNYPDSDRIYRIVGEFKVKGKTIRSISFPPPMALAIKKDFPEVERSGRLMPNNLFEYVGSNYVRSANSTENTYEQGFAYADQQLLDILQPAMVYGKREKALTGPKSIVISRRMADKYFPNQDPVGKTLVLNDNASKPYTIGGVMENIASTSHLQFDFLLTLSGVELWPGEQSSWASSNYVDYVKLRPGTDSKAFAQKLTKDLIQNYFLPSMEAAG